MNKTPVSILHEMMAKKCAVPNYELVHDGGGTHSNTFTYRVTCDGLSANGTGRCKKGAKHNAATAMLEAIAKHRGYPQLPASPAQSPGRTPLLSATLVSPQISPNEPFVNAIGALQELCLENHLEEPSYIPISDVGPAHARVFTIQCVVATFKEEGVATTKKQAKHFAAKRMLERITDLVGDMKCVDSGVEDQCDKIERDDTSSDELAKLRYPSLTRLFVKKSTLGLKLSEYHIKLKSSLCNETRLKLINELCSLVQTDCSIILTESIEETLTKLKDLLVTLNLKITDLPLDSKDPLVHIYAMQIDTCPDIVQVGLGKTKEEAQARTISKLIKSILLLLE